MQDALKTSIQGFVKIKDKITGEVLVDTHNDVLYGNMAAALAYSLIGNPNSFLYYMGFGNGGAYVSPTGTIAYRESRGGINGLIKNPTANLYNTIYVKKISNDDTQESDYDPLSKAYIPEINYSTNYEDIVIDVTLTYNEPLFNSTSGYINQLQIDNSSFVGTTETNTSGTFNPNTFVFNEIGLFAGSSNLFPGDYTQTVEEVNSFINQTPNFNYSLGSKSKIMLTHVVFHPVQKSANRELEIIYTLRIQMGVAT